MHCALLAACVEKKDEVTNLCKPPTDVEQFLIGHIDGGVVTAARQLGKSQDDVFLLLYTVLTQLTQVDGEDLSLTTHAGRVVWENKFARELVRTSVAKLDDVGDWFRELVKEDQEAETGRLYSVSPRRI